MKFTDRFFAFPIRIYDKRSLEKVLNQEDLEDIVTTEPAWVRGEVKFPVNELEGIIWHDGFKTGRNVKEVAEKGFDLTVIHSEKYGLFFCLWKKEEFEQRLNDFIEQFESKEEPHERFSEHI